MKHVLEFAMENQKPFKNEKEFTNRFGKQIRDRWGFWHKISDMSLEHKPCDAIIGLWWYTWLCEIKVSDHKRKVDVYNMLRPNQKRGLKRRQKNGGTSIVVYYNKHHHQYFVLNFDEKMELLFTKQDAEEI